MSDSLPQEWFVYVIRASDDSLYTGITTDIERRWRQHASGKGGARYFRGRQPRQLVFLQGGFNRRTASVREAAIKNLDRRGKERLLAEAAVSASCPGAKVSLRSREISPAR